jgi:dolichol-phosphate mannosyltransferase
MRPELSIVVPCYNEEDVLPLLAERLRPVADALQTPYEVVAVDDGSTDATAVVLQRMRREWPELRVVRLRANAGHQAAISAGLARALGDYVVTLDADLQDPPEVIPGMLEAARGERVDVVYGVRGDRSTDSAFKRVSARAFYRVIRALSGTHAPSDAGDFRMMSRATVDAVNALPEENRVLRFIVPALGFPSATVTYRREERAAGRSKYPLAKMVRLSIDSVTGFSIAPLRAATWVGLAGGVAAFALLVYALLARLLGHTTPGWTSTVVTVAAVGAVQLLCLGILGEYVGRMYAMMQARPTYFVAYDSLTGPATSADAALPSPTVDAASTAVVDDRAPAAAVDGDSADVSTGDATGGAPSPAGSRPASA